MAACRHECYAARDRKKKRRNKNSISTTTHTHKIANDFLVKMHVISSNEAKTHTQTQRVTA